MTHRRLPRRTTAGGEDPPSPRDRVDRRILHQIIPDPSPRQPPQRIAEIFPELRFAHRTALDLLSGRRIKILIPYHVFTSTFIPAPSSQRTALTRGSPARISPNARETLLISARVSIFPNHRRISALEGSMKQRKPSARSSSLPQPMIRGNA